MMIVNSFVNGQCVFICVTDSPSDATEAGGLADEGSDVTHSACGGKWLSKCYKGNVQTLSNSQAAQQQ